MILMLCLIILNINVFLLVLVLQLATPFCNFNRIKCLNSVIILFLLSFSLYTGSSALFFPHIFFSFIISFHNFRKNIPRCVQQYTRCVRWLHGSMDPVNIRDAAARRSSRRRWPGGCALCYLYSSLFSSQDKLRVSGFLSSVIDFERDFLIDIKLHLKMPKLPRPTGRPVVVWWGSMGMFTTV